MNDKGNAFVDASTLKLDVGNRRATAYSSVANEKVRRTIVLRFQLEKL